MDIERIKAVVFDCDGVMFDTSLSNRKFYDEVLGAFSRPELNDEQFVHVHMMTVKDAVEYLFPQIDDVRDVYKCIKKIGYQKFIRYMSMEKGFEDLLKFLKEKGYIVGIATNRTDTMEKILEDYRIEDYFDIVMTAAKVKNPKPDPEQLMTILEQFDLHPDELLFVGDSIYDCQAAMGAGVRFAAFKNSEMEADVRVESMEEISRLLTLNK